MPEQGKYRIIPGVEITGIHSSGRAWGYHGNKKIYLDAAVPGDVVDVKVPKRYRGFLAGTIERIVHPSPHRIVPFCKHFAVCGGCNWMPVRYEYQLELKRRILLEAFQKYEIEISSLPTVYSSPQTLFFRNRCEFAFSAAGNVVGFHPAGNPHQVFETEECFLQPEPSMSIVRKIKETALAMAIPFYHPEEKKEGLRKLVLRMASGGDLMVLLGGTGIPAETLKRMAKEVHSAFPQIGSVLYEEMMADDRSAAIQLLSGYREVWEETANGLRFFISPHTFYQPHSVQAEKMFGRVVSLLDLKGNERIIDLYCGAGTFTLHVARLAAEVIGIDGSTSAINDAIRNAEVNGIHHVKFIQGDILTTFTPTFLQRCFSPDVIILDPPRAGTLMEIKKNIVAARPAKIVYISCNPVSLAWDMKFFIPYYRITAIEMYDQYPHTHHVETLVMLERR